MVSHLSLLCLRAAVPTPRHPTPWGYQHRNISMGVPIWNMPIQIPISEENYDPCNIVKYIPACLQITRNKSHRWCQAGRINLGYHLCKISTYHLLAYQRLKLGPIGIPKRVKETIFSHTLRGCVTPSVAPKMDPLHFVSINYTAQNI